MVPWWIDVTRGYLSGHRLGSRKRNQIRIFTYHGIVERKSDPRLERNLHLLSNFQAHLRFLSHFRVISLAELAEELSFPTRNSKQAAVITFDDGYANNLLAGEILAQARLPWAVFISTGAIGQENSIWTVELSLLILHGQAEKIEVLDRVWSLKSRKEREIAFQAIRYSMKAMPAPLRRRTMSCIRQQFPQEEPQRLLREFPSLQMLTWEEIKQLANVSVEIGSHGINHEIHHRSQPEAIRWQELIHSKTEIERKLGCSCHYFAFPNGDFTTRSSLEAEKAGYKLAFTTQDYTITSNFSPFLLPRLSPPATLNRFVQSFFWKTTA